MKIEYMQGSNVVSISPVRARINFPSIGRVEAYWEGLRNGRMMPARVEIDPRGIADVLEYAFVLEKIAPGLARIRLAGMHLNDLMAMEVRGMPLTAMFLPEARREMQKVLENVLESPAVVRLTLASDMGFGRKPLEAQMILMPLRDEQGVATRIFGALQARGEIGRGPRRFTIRDMETKPLMSETARPERRPAPRPAASLDEADQPFAPRTAALAEQIRRAQALTRAHDESAKAQTRAPGARAEEPAPRLRLVFDADEVDA